MVKRRESIQNAGKMMVIGCLNLFWVCPVFLLWRWDDACILNGLIGHIIILKGNQSWGIEKVKTKKRAYINQMTSGRTQFLEIVQKVEAGEQFNEILTSQLGRYQVQLFKGESLDCESIRSLYLSLDLKYHETKELTEDPENWNEHEKKVFIWFIIFYVYFLQLEGKQLNSSSWPELSPIFFNKKPEFLQFQYLNMLKLQGKISWTPEEDHLLVEAVNSTDLGKWNEVAKYYFYQSNFTMFKSPKHCRERWLNHLDQKKKRGSWTPEEDIIIFKFVAENGKRWCKLVPILKEERTEHMIKNRFNSLMNRQKYSRKEREDHMVQKIIRQLKKQISNIEKRKQKKEEKLEKLKEEKSEEGNTEKNAEESLAVKMEDPKIEANSECIEQYPQSQEDKQSQINHHSTETNLKQEEIEENAIQPEDNQMPMEVPAPYYYPVPYYQPSPLMSYPYVYPQQQMMPFYFPYGSFGSY